VGADSGRWICDPYVVSLIRNKARQLVGHYGFTEDDREDIEQELWADLYHRAPNYDPSLASPRTFANRVIEHAIARIIEHRKYAIRDYRQCVCSLNDPVVGEDGEQAERVDLLDQDAYLESLGQSTSSLADQVAAHVDVERLRAMLPPELRIFLDQLGEGQGLVDISRETGTRRGTLWRRLQKLARTAGIEDR
jgi:RNA polymerase sigma-70 factor (ECF subfamily)